MLHKLTTHPLVITKFPLGSMIPGSDYKFCELRLLFNPKLNSDENCDVLLTYLNTDDKWNPQPRTAPFHQTEGKAKLTPLDGGAVEITGNLPIPPLTADTEGILPAKPEEEKKLYFRVELSERTLVPGLQPRLRGRVIVKEQAPFAPPPTETAPRARVRLFKANLEGTDSSGSVTGRYYLPLVPVTVGTADPVPILKLFEKQLTTATALWGDGGIHLVKQDPVRIPASRQALLQLGRGQSDELFDQIKTLANQITGIPILLVDKRFANGGGFTEPSFPTRNTFSCIMCHEDVKNEVLLAHEIGHVLGGAHDGETVSGKWMETLDEGSVMKETTSIAEMGNAKIGQVAKSRAPSWALFEEIPVSGFGRLAQSLRKKLGSFP